MLMQKQKKIYLVWYKTENKQILTCEKLQRPCFTEFLEINQ